LRERLHKVRRIAIREDRNAVLRAKRIDELMSSQFRLIKRSAGHPRARVNREYNKAWQVAIDTAGDGCYCDILGVDLGMDVFSC
jgi:hypothetical protein